MRKKNKTFFVIALMLTAFMITVVRADWGLFESMVYTTEVTDITDFTAESGVSITLIQDDPGVTQKGVCWSTSAHPTIDVPTKTEQGSGPGQGPSSGSFTSSLTDLLPGTTYYIRAYATNSDGTYYGNEISFRTTNTVPTMTEWALILLGAVGLVFGVRFVVRMS